MSVQDRIIENFSACRDRDRSNGLRSYGVKSKKNETFLKLITPDS